MLALLMFATVAHADEALDYRYAVGHYDTLTELLDPASHPPKPLIDFDVPVQQVTFFHEDLLKSSHADPLHTALRRTPGVLADHDRIFINGTPATTGNFSLDGVMLLMP